MEIEWTADAQGRITYFNPTWFDLTGVRPESTYGSAERWMQVIHPDDYDRVAAFWRLRSLALDAYEVYFRIRTVSGEYATFRGMAGPARDGMRVTQWVGRGRLVESC